MLEYHLWVSKTRPDGFDWTPFDAANRLTTSVQSPCVAITARVEAITLYGPAFWLDLKNCLWCVAWTILQRTGEKHKLIQIPYH